MVILDLLCTLNGYPRNQQLIAGPGFAGFLKTICDHEPPNMILEWQEFVYFHLWVLEGTGKYIAKHNHMLNPYDGRGTIDVTDMIDFLKTQPHDHQVCNGLRASQFLMRVALVCRRSEPFQAFNHLLIQIADLVKCWDHIKN